MSETQTHPAARMRPLSSAAEAAVPRRKPEAPPRPVNISLPVARAEWAILAETEPEALLKGLLLECRELVRGTANVLSTPESAHLHDESFRFLQGAAETAVKLANSIARLRQGPVSEERCQRIVVERIDRGVARPQQHRGEGAPGPAKNE